MGYTAKVKATAQAFTANAADWGAEINTAGYRYLHLYLTIDINQTLNARLKFLRKHTSAGSEEYPDYLLTVASNVTTTGAEKYWEIGSDSDHKPYLKIDLERGVPYVQLQIWAGTAGVTPGTIVGYYILSY